MRHLIAWSCVAAALGCGPSGVAELVSGTPPAAQSADAGAPAAVPPAAPQTDAGPAEVAPLPACRPDPFVSPQPGQMKFAAWLVDGSSCAGVGIRSATGIPSSDEAISDADNDGYLEWNRTLPVGDYDLELRPTSCRTQESVPRKAYTDGDLRLVHSPDRDVFSCWYLPIVSCIDHGGNIYDCWIERIKWFCGLRISIAPDGTITGSGGGIPNMLTYCQ